MKPDYLNKEILRLSIPTIVSNVTIPLLGICDTAISGHLGSEIFLAAIAVGSVMLNVVFWIFGFLRGGTTGLTANALGAGSESEVAKVFYRSLIIAFVAGGFILCLQVPLFSFLWWFTDSGPEVRQYVEEYFSYRVWGAPALLGVIAISGWFVGMQTTFYPMVIAIVMNIINIICSCLLVFFTELGFSGVAIGTLISNWLGLFLAIGCVMFFRKGKPLEFDAVKIFKGEWWRYFSVNGNLFLRSFFIICVTMGVTSAGSKLGPLTLAVNVIVMQFFQFFSFFMDGIAFSGEAMIGLRAGEGSYVNLKLCVRRLLKWTFATGILFSALYFIGLSPVSSLLTDNSPVIENVVSLRPWVSLIPIVSCWAFIFDGFYIGITDTFKMMISALIGAVVFFLIISLIIYGENSETFSYDNRIIWTAFLSYLLGRGIYLSAMWNKSLRARSLRSREYSYG